MLELKMKLKVIEEAIVSFFFSANLQKVNFSFQKGIHSLTLQFF